MTPASVAAATPGPTTRLHPRLGELMEWRRSAQRVTRAWNAWLAADRRDRGVRYRAFVAALADEERAAAEVERMIDLAEAGLCLTNIHARTSRVGER